MIKRLHVVQYAHAAPVFVPDPWQTTLLWSGNHLTTDLHISSPRAHRKWVAYHALWQILDWIFPPECIGCKKIGERICPTCLEKMVPLPRPRCTICSLPLPAERANRQRCRECSTSRPAYAKLQSAVLYRGIGREALIRLKYRRDFGLAEPLTELMAPLLSQFPLKPDFITCVPLSSGRLKSRGYNQAAQLARVLAWQTGIPFKPLLLRKTIEAPSQVGLTAQARKENVQDAFSLGQFDASAKILLIVDDVATSGATMNACSRVLLDAGAETVYGLTFARAGIADHNLPEKPENH